MIRSNRQSGLKHKRKLKQVINDLLEKADALRAQDKYKQAESIYADAHRRTALLGFDVGESLYQQGEYEQARAKLEAVRQSDVDVGRSRTRKADEYLAYLQHAAENRKLAQELYAAQLQKPQTEKLARKERKQKGEAEMTNGRSR